MSDLVKYFSYLDKLRESGKINMVEADRYLQSEFKLDKEQAYTIWYMWGSTFSDKSVEERVALVSPV